MHITSQQISDRDGRPLQGAVVDVAQCQVGLDQNRSCSLAVTGAARGADHGKVVKATDGQRDRLCSPISAGCSERVAETLSTLHSLNTAVAVVECVGPHPSRRHIHRAVRRGRTACNRSEEIGCAVKIAAV